jgi:hypothetical protein
MCISAEAAAGYTRANLKLLSGLPNAGEIYAALDWIEDTATDQLADIALRDKRP